MNERLSKTKLKDIRALTTAKGRAEAGRFLVEGERIVRDVVAKGISAHVAIFDEEALHSKPTLQKLAASFNDRALLAEPKDFLAIADTENSQGVVAIFDLPKPGCQMAAKTQRASFLVLDNVRDPGNMGTVFRHASAFSCAGIFLVRGCCDPFNPKAVRASMGGVFDVAYEMDVEAEALAARFKKDGVALFACENVKDARNAFDATLPSHCAFIIGGETEGIHPAWKTLGAQSVAIPQSARMESLNAAVAASIVLALRYRA
ncbi:MAG: RNA methyltransferase [Planctomycetes bacterium]|nr:RNA methyltransferase [Planctomycetota bacterium]NUQ34936.1 RNA methyltransferase [Planctomycetaceae bacterium]